ncbi:MAG: hypothetical protein C0511_03885 [Hyphomicrobium sp.]|nr:hypothetical protein [Hyphomicrobium sp.]
MKIAKVPIQTLHRSRIEVLLVDQTGGVLLIKPIGKFLDPFSDLEVQVVGRHGKTPTHHSISM